MKSLILAGIILGLTVAASHAEDHSEARESARVRAVLFDSGHMAVGKIQDLMNNPAKAGKGFTPAVPCAPRQLVKSMEGDNDC